MKALISAVVLVCLALLAGCGGGGDSASTTATLTKEQFIKQADKICDQAYNERGKLFRPFLKNPEKYAQLSPAEKEEFVVNEILPTYSRTAESLRDLPPPTGDEAQLDEIFTTLEETIKRVEKDPSTFLEGAEAEFSELEAMTAKYGFQTCIKS